MKYSQHNYCIKLAINNYHSNIHQNKKNKNKISHPNTSGLFS